MATGGEDTDKGEENLYKTSKINCDVKNISDESLTSLILSFSKLENKYILVSDFSTYVNENPRQQGGGERKKRVIRDVDLVRELPHEVLQELEIHLRPEKAANRKNWRNLGSLHGIKPIEMDYMETQESAVMKMLCQHAKFARYTVAELLEDLQHIERLDILDCLKDDHNIG